MESGNHCSANLSCRHISDEILMYKVINAWINLVFSKDYKLERCAVRVCYNSDKDCVGIWVGEDIDDIPSREFVRDDFTIIGNPYNYCYQDVYERGDGSGQEQYDSEVRKRFLSSFYSDMIGKLKELSRTFHAELEEQ